MSEAAGQPGTALPVVTRRLVMRRWCDADLEPFATMNADPEVMRYLPQPLDRAASDALAARADRSFDERGWGLAAVEERSTGRFVGFIGLHEHQWYPGEVEIGWRLARDVWGQGLATEGAQAWLDLAFSTFGLPRVISITMAGNAASLAVMRHLGLTPWQRMERDGMDIVVTKRDAPGPGA